MKKKTISGENLLSGAEVKALLDVEGVLGGSFDPECATIHPYNLVLALTRYLSSRSVSLFEGALATPAPGGVLVNSSFINAEIVIQATEVFGRPGRDFIPLYSLMVATEPLSAATWEKLGNPNRFTFAEASHMINYAQRTPDNRIAIGGRGATYPFGSRLRDRKEHDGQVHDRLKQLLRSWFPELEQVQFTHAWGGAVAITRDWEPYVQWHPEMKFARLGGYAGDGVTMSHLAAKILAHEILDRDCELRSLHFVNRTIRPWEVEPLRYLGVNAMVKLSGIADKEEQITKRASLLNRVIEPLILR